MARPPEERAGVADVNLAGTTALVTSVEDGAAALLNAAVAPDLDGISGRYFAKQRSKTPSGTARDPDLARALWERSADLLDVEEPLADAVEA